MALDFPSENDVKTDIVNQINNNTTFCFKAKTNQNAPRPWVCKICSFPFKFKGNLLEHMRFYHMKGNVPCNHCEKTFPTSKQLRNHMREHSVARNQCPHCGSKLGKTANAYDEHLKVCKRRPKNTLLIKEVLHSLASTETNNHTVVSQNPELPQKRQKFDVNCNDVFSKQCSLCLLKFTDENIFQQHQCLPSAASNCDIVMSDSENQQKVDSSCNNIVDKHCSTCQLKFADENSLQQHKCLPVAASCTAVMSCLDNSTSNAVQTCSNLTCSTATQSIPNLLPRTETYNQQQFTPNKYSLPTLENFGINVNPVTYNAGASIASYTQFIPQNQTLPSYYRNNLNTVPSTYSACMLPYTARFSSQPHLYNDFSKVNSFNPVANNIRSPLQYLSHITAALENQQLYNPANPSFASKPQTYQLANGNLFNEHCAECRHPLPLTQLNTRDFVAHVCPYCSAMYKKIECLDSHISNVHLAGLNKSPNFINVCANGHNSLFCSYCKRYFCDRQAFIAHLRQCFANEHNIVANKWNCDRCKNTFDTKLHFLQHSAWCQVSFQNQLPGAFSETVSVLRRNKILEPYTENKNKDISEVHANHCSNVDGSSNSSSNNQSNTNCMKCKEISNAFGKQKFCVSCFLKLKLSEDFEMIKRYKMSLHLSPKSIIYKPIDSHLFQLTGSDSTELKCYFCENYFSDVQHFQVHLNSCNKFKNNPSPDLAIVCCQCSRTFAAIISFQAHVLNCQNVGDCLVKTKALSNVRPETCESLEVNKSLQTGAKLKQQSTIKADVWECELCRKEFSNFLVFAIHVSACNKNTQHSKLPKNLEVSKEVSEKCNEINLILQKEKQVLLYCSKCGHKFKSELDLQVHPCDEILKYMTTCFVQLECLKFSKIIMRQLLSMYGYPNGCQMKKKQCLSYRKQYNEVFQNPNKHNQVLKARWLKTNHQAGLINPTKGAMKENINEHDKLLAKLVCDYEKKFHQRNSHFPAEIYSQKFVCSCGQVRSYLQASVHMKIHRNSKNHQIKLLKPLIKSVHDKYQKLAHVFCKNCKQDFHNVELFTGHTIFSFNCRKLYKAIAKSHKCTKPSEIESSNSHNHDISSVTLNQIEKCNIDHKNCLTETLHHSINLNPSVSSFELNNVDVNNSKDTSLKSDDFVNTYANEFADKITNFIKTEISSGTKQQQSAQSDYPSFSEHLQHLEHSKSKQVKKSISDGFMIELDCPLEETVNSLASKYICGNCYRSLYSKAALLDHLKQEHSTHGIIKLSVISKQTSSGHTVQTVDSIKSSVINGQNYTLNNTSVTSIPWSPVITSVTSLGGPSMGI